MKLSDLKNEVSLALEAMSNRGKRVLSIYALSLAIISGLDGLAIWLLSKNLLSSNATADVMQIGLVIALFISKSLLSTFISWLAMREFAKEEVLIGQKKLNELGQAKWKFLSNQKSSDYFTLVDRSPNSLVQYYLVFVATIFAESISALLIFTALTLIQPATSIIAFSYFIGVAVIQHRILGKRSTLAGQQVLNKQNQVYELLSEGYFFRKGFKVRKSLSFERVLENERNHLAIARANLLFISSLPRYVMEIVLAFGFVLIAIALWTLNGTQAVAGGLSIFAAAAYRLLPTINRIQNLVLALFGSKPLALEVVNRTIPQEEEDRYITADLSDDLIIKLKDVSFMHDGMEADLLESINLDFEAGKSYAIVGSSGSGKTTLIDLILGLYSPTNGEVIHSDKFSENVFAYVPQDAYLIRGSLCENIALEWAPETIDFPKVKLTIKTVQLGSLYEDVKESEISKDLISGGQAQRINLARAIYSNAPILVLDEVTSALDAETEQEVMEQVLNLGGEKTLIIVAHRLSTIQKVDQIIYLQNGKIRAVGDFANLRKSVPEFERLVQIGKLD